jgi:hypothetical protein
VEWVRYTAARAEEEKVGRRNNGRLNVLEREGQAGALFAE